MKIWSKELIYGKKNEATIEGTMLHNVSKEKKETEIIIVFF